MENQTKKLLFYKHYYHFVIERMVVHWYTLHTKENEVEVSDLL